MRRFGGIAIGVAVLLALIWLGGSRLARSYEFRPQAEVAAPHWTGPPPREVTVTTADGLTLHGYYWPAGAAKDVLVVFHGNGGSQQRMAQYAEPFTAGGHGVLIASYRGYGGNPGSPSATGLLTDADAWIALARSLLPPGGKLYIYGHSLGGGVALGSAARHPVDGVATLGTFSRIADVAPWYAGPFIADEFDNAAAIRKITAPVILLHGDRDDTIPYENAPRLLAASQGRARLIRFRGGGHSVSLSRVAPIVWQAFGQPSGATAR